MSLNPSEEPQLSQDFDANLSQAWSEIDAELARFDADCELGKHCDENFSRDFRAIVCQFCPPHDFKRDSVQRRILDFFGQTAWNQLAVQDDARARAGFRFACQHTMGSDNADDFDTAASFFFSRVRILGHMPILLREYQDIVMRALLRGDADFFEKLAKSLRSARDRRPENLVRLGNPLPTLDIGIEICRNWTNPDLPLWMLGDDGLKLAVQFLSNGFIDGRAIHKRIERMRLQRFRKRPISRVEVSWDSEAKRSKFLGFGFASKIAPLMDGVTISGEPPNFDVWVRRPS